MRRLLTRVAMLVSLALGAAPRAVRLIDLLQMRSVARVIIVRRRRPDYADMFTAEDLRGRPIPMARRTPHIADVTYRRVDAA